MAGDQTVVQLPPSVMRALSGSRHIPDIRADLQGAVLVLFAELLRLGDLTPAEFAERARAEFGMEHIDEALVRLWSAGSGAIGGDALLAAIGCAGPPGVLLVATTARSV